MRIIYYQFGEFVKTFETRRPGTYNQLKEWFEEMSNSKVISIRKAQE